MLRIFSFLLSLAPGPFSEPHFSPTPEQSLSQHILKTDVASSWEWVTPMGAAGPHNGDRIGSRKDWVVTCDGQQDSEHDCLKTIDGDRNTHWLTSQNSSSAPNTITVDLREIQKVNGIAVLPRQDDSIDGNIATHEIYLSKDGKDWAPVAYGTWWMDATGSYALYLG